MKLTITIEDKPDGKVSVVTEPTVAQVFLADQSGSEDITSATGYFFTAINAIRKAAKDNSPLKVLIPRIGR